MLLVMNEIGGGERDGDSGYGNRDKSKRGTNVRSKWMLCSAVSLCVIVLVFSVLLIFVQFSLDDSDISSLY